MSADWLAAGLTIATIALSEAWFAIAQRSRPRNLARSAHARLRQDWFEAVAKHPGSEILAVQTVRNSLMSASITASTAVLGLMGTVTLSASTLGRGLGDGGQSGPGFAPRLAMELILLALLFASLVSAVMAVRYYNHAGFVCAIPVGSEGRRRWHAVGSSHIRRAGILYSWSVRNLVLVAPAVAFLLHPLAGPPAAMLVALALFAFDRVPA